MPTSTPPCGKSSSARTSPATTTTPIGLAMGQTASLIPTTPTSAATCIKVGTIRWNQYEHDLNPPGICQDAAGRHRGTEPAAAAGERDKAQRDRLLELLGKHNAFVLSGHIHKYNLLVRATPWLRSTARESAPGFIPESPANTGAHWH